MNSIPASQLVSVQPGVLGAGGNPLSLNGVFLTTDPSVPIGTVASFADAQDVATFFGPSAPETIAANIYFAGFTGRNTAPGEILFAQYNTAAVAGYERGGSLSGVALGVIQGLSGTITVALDGVSTVSGSINLASASSFSNAAALIQTALQAGTPTNTATVTYDSIRAAFVITSSTTGNSSSVGFPATDSLTTGLLLTAATGAVLSPGAAIAVPAALMNSIVAQTQNWFTFTTVGEPLIAVKEAFAAWVQTTDDAYKYVVSDSDVTALSANASATFGAIVKAAGYDGVVVIYDPTSGELAAFEMGTTASIDPTETNGRITFAYKSQAGLAASVTDATSAQNLIGNGYNFYGAYATANQAFTFYQPGQMAGQWQWDDAYTNQRIINSALQLALVELLANTKSVPYTNLGYNLIRAACLDPINQALAFGAIQPGVTLSAAQAAEVNTAAGVKIDTTLSTVGWYLQILDPGSIVRGQRGSPKCTFWYTDGGSVQKINLASIDVE
jgi:Protein of unknown function (DUF3383)